MASTHRPDAIGAAPRQRPAWVAMLVGALATGVLLGALAALVFVGLIAALIVLVAAGVVATGVALVLGVLWPRSGSG